MVYLGVDIGGMSMKCGAVTPSGEILAKRTCITPLGDVPAAVAAIADLCRQTAAEAQIQWDEVAAIGMGAPGTVNKNVVTYATNLGWYDVPLADLVAQATGKKAAVANDANCALLAEWKLGAGVGYDNLAMITLGTGIGTAFVCDGRLLLGNGSASGEGGHIRIKNLGRRCSCGREDCFELYASASSLLERTAALAKEEPDGICAAIAKENGGVNGFTLFAAIDKGDESAKKVLAEFQSDIVDGLTDIANILRPQAFVMGGGICREDKLIEPLEAMLNARTLGGAHNPHVAILRPRFFNDAGIIGAAVAAMEL